MAVILWTVWKGSVHISYMFDRKMWTLILLCKWLHYPSDSFQWQQLVQMFRAMVYGSLTDDSDPVKHIRIAWPFLYPVACQTTCMVATSELVSSINYVGLTAVMLDDRLNNQWANTVTTTIVWLFVAIAKTKSSPLCQQSFFLYTHVA